MEIFIFMLFAVALFYSGYYTGKRDAHDPVPFFPQLPEIVTQTIDKVRQRKPDPIEPDDERSNAFYQ